jgi:hypothetical protein
MSQQGDGFRGDLDRYAQALADAGAQSDTSIQGTDRGPLGWWLRLTAPDAPPASAPFETREWARRGRLVSVLLLAFLVIEAAALWLYVIVDDDHPTMKLALLVALGLALVAALLNRIGEVPWAGFLMVALADLPAVGIPATAIGGQLDVLHLGALYLLAGSELVAASVLIPGIVFFVAAANSAIIIALLDFMPHTDALGTVLASNNAPQAYAGPIAMQLIVALVSFLWARSALMALRRADRAEELAMLERREIERTREVEEGVQQLLAIHVRMANGDFSARVPPMRNASLWRIGVSLNNLIARFSRLAQVDHLLSQTRSEAHRLSEALLAQRMGLRPVLPAPSGTPLDEVIAALSDAPASPAPPDPFAPGSSPGRNDPYPPPGWPPPYPGSGSGPIG